MKESFEESLRQYNEFSKKENSVEGERFIEFEDPDELAQNIDHFLRDSAATHQTDVSVQKEIYAIQKQKRLIMERFKQRLASLGDVEVYRKQEGECTATYDEEKGVFTIEGDNQKSSETTFGKMISDLDWGATYHIPVTGKQSLRLAKRYLLAKTRRDLMELLNDQIIHNETSSLATDAIDRRSYTNFQKGEKDGINQEQAGFISESLVKNMLQQATLDFDVPFEIQETDIFQDVHQKIDFIIRRKEVARGVEITADESYKDIGIQFTINGSAYDHKQYQIKESKQRLAAQKDHVKDIVLVCFPTRIPLRLKRRWEQEGKPSGGPIVFLDRKEAHIIFSSLLKEIFSEEEIKSFWSKVQSRFRDQKALFEEELEKLIEIEYNPLKQKVLSDPFLYSYTESEFQSMLQELKSFYGENYGVAMKNKQLLHEYRQMVLKRKTIITEQQIDAMSAYIVSVLGKGADQGLKAKQMLGVYKRLKEEEKEREVVS